MHESVSVYVWNSVLKGQNVLSIPFLFYSLFTGICQNWVKLLYFLQNYLCHIYLYYFAIVVIINKAFKLFNLVLVVYCDSC